MSDLIVRSFPADLEVRADARTICGIACPFGEEAQIREYGGSYAESFAPTAFDRTIRERGDRVKALVMHQRDLLPVGRAVMLRPDARGLYAELRISKTDLGDQVLELVSDGALDALSVGFMPVKGGDQWDRTQSKVLRTEVALREISIVDEPAYAGALITGLRSAERTMSLETAKRLFELAF